MVWKPGSKHSDPSSRVIARRNDWNSICVLHQGPRSMAASRGRIHDRSPIACRNTKKTLAERGPSIHDGEGASERADREIAQPQIGVAAFFPDPEQRPVQRLAQEIVALAHGDADALAKIAALDKRPAGEGAAFGGIRAVDPEGKRDRVAKDQVDLGAAKRKAQRIVAGEGTELGSGERSLQICMLHGSGE